MSANRIVSVERYGTAPAFLDAAHDFLVAREAEHNLIFGICATLTADPGYSNEPYLATVSTAAASRSRVSQAQSITPGASPRPGAGGTV